MAQEKGVISTDDNISTIDEVSVRTTVKHYLNKCVREYYFYEPQDTAVYTIRPILKAYESGLIKELS